jgi:hypothetical protein
MLPTSFKSQKNRAAQKHCKPQKHGVAAEIRFRRLT